MSVRLPIQIALALTLLTSVTLCAADTVRLTTGHWPPYLVEGSETGGFMAQIIREAFATQGLQVDFDFRPWSRALMLASTNTYHGTAVWSCTSTRARRFLLSDPILPFRFVFYHRAEEPLGWQTFRDLKGKRVGLTQDYAYGKMLTKAARRGIVETDMIASTKGNFRKLVAGRIDLFPMDPVVGTYLIKNELPPIAAGKINFDPTPVREAAYHVLFNEERADSKRIREGFNRGLKELRASGRLDELVPQKLPSSSTSIARSLGPNNTTACLVNKRS